MTISKTTSLAVLLLGLTALCSGDVAQPERHCTAAGSICSTCDTVAVCVGTGDGAFETLLQPCQEGERCVGGLCIQGALCNYRPFNCSDEGYYPDPYDCQTYHICLPSGTEFAAATFTCPGLSAYNASSQDCTATLASEACVSRPVPECLSRLQMGPIPGDDGLYYVCIERDDTVAAELRRCPAGRHFDAESVTCVDSAQEKKDKKDKKKKKSKA